MDFIYTILFNDSGTFQDDTPFFVPLLFFCCILIYPTKLSIAILARHISNHVAASQHHTVLHLAECEIHDFVEEEGTASCSSESR